MTKIKINENITIELTLPEVMTVEEFEKVATSVINTVDEEEEHTNISGLFNALNNAMALRNKIQTELKEQQEKIEETKQPTKVNLKVSTPVKTSNKKTMGAKKKYTESEIAFIKKAKKDGYKAKEIVEMFNKKYSKKQINEALYYYIISRNK